MLSGDYRQAVAISDETEDRGSGRPLTELLTIGEAAKLLRCSKPHVSNLLAGRVRGVAPLPHIQLGRRKLIRRATIRQWMAAAEAARW